MCVLLTSVLFSSFFCISDVGKVFLAHPYISSRGKSVEVRECCNDFFQILTLKETKLLSTQFIKDVYVQGPIIYFIECRFPKRNKSKGRCFDGKLWLFWYVNFEGKICISSYPMKCCSIKKPLHPTDLIGKTFFDICVLHDIYALNFFHPSSFVLGHAPNVVMRFCSLEFGQRVNRTDCRR